MIKPDEKELRRAVLAGESFRNAAERLGIPLKRAEWIGTKWSRRGWYCYGVSPVCGWLTDEGRQQLPKGLSNGPEKSE